MQGIQTPATLRKENCYDDVGTFGVIVNWNSSANTSCARNPTVVVGQHLWLSVLHDQYNVYHKILLIEPVLIAR
jgi:hypothetical protein